MKKIESLHLYGYNVKIHKLIVLNIYILIYTLLIKFSVVQAIFQKT